MFKNIECYFKDIIRKKKTGILSYLIRCGLLPLSWGYQAIIRGRNWLYDQGWMKHYVPPVPLVVSVGNIVAGGSGKTPVTLLLADAFYVKFSIAILSRGYRSRVEKLDQPVVLCEGRGPLYSASYCGDEPYLFAQRLPKACVIVGRDRQKASYLAAKTGVQMILLDDGMQHRSLARDFDIVVIDANDPFGQDYFLPRGFLRESKTSLSRAHLIVINHISDKEHFEAIKKQVTPYTNAPMIGTCWQFNHMYDLQGEVCSPVPGEKVGMFCGIAYPERFKKTLEDIGFDVVAEYKLADHAEIREKDLERFAKVCQKKEAQWLICTEKDRVKLKDHLCMPLPIAWIKMDLKVTEGQNEWQTFLSKIESKMF